MCDAFGYYTVTQGYRKVPGNKCSGGLDLAPYTYSCSSMGGWFTLSNILLAVIVAAVLYFGWPIIEAIIIMLPIPDPKDIKERIGGLFSGSNSNSNK